MKIPRISPSVFLFAAVVFILLLLPLKNVGVYGVKHTHATYSITSGFEVGSSKICSPGVLLHVDEFGVENVVSSCIIAKHPLNVNCTCKKLTERNVALKAACLKTAEHSRVVWILSLYSKHTLFNLTKIVLANETLRLPSVPSYGS